MRMRTENYVTTGNGMGDYAKTIVIGYVISGTYKQRTKN